MIAKTLVLKLFGQVEKNVASLAHVQWEIFSIHHKQGVVKISPSLHNSNCGAKRMPTRLGKVDNQDVAKAMPTYS